MTNKSNKRDNQGNSSNLDSRYGSIGISAVAAALQFKREVKKPAPAPADTRGQEQKHPDMAA